MTLELEKADAVGIATAIKASEISAKAVLSAALERIAVQNEVFNCFTAVTADTALADAEQIDKAISQGENPGTLGRLSRAGAFLLSSSFDHIGPFARSVRDIATTFDILQGADASDPICTTRPPEPCLPQLNQGIEDLRIAIADGYFSKGAEPEVFEAVAKVARALDVTASATIAEPHRQGRQRILLPLLRGQICILPICDRALNILTPQHAIAF
jgi:Asp-tRNA(Asn)/Glu-tRNA(Gln) amidotransferase A subunit family amidase